MDRPQRPSERIRAARANRRPPRYAATLLALGIIFALAYVFIIHTPPAPPVPSITSLTGSYSWSGRARARPRRRHVPGDRERRRERAGGRAAGARRARAARVGVRARRAAPR